MILAARVFIHNQIQRGFKNDRIRSKLNHDFEKPKNFSNGIITSRIRYIGRMKTK